MLWTKDWSERAWAPWGLTPVLQRDGTQIRATAISAAGGMVKPGPSWLLLDEANRPPPSDQAPSGLDTGGGTSAAFGSDSSARLSPGDQVVGFLGKVTLSSYANRKMGESLLVPELIHLAQEKDAYPDRWLWLGLRIAGMELINARLRKGLAP